MTTTNEETSLALAEDYVREQLRKETFEQGLKYGDEIDVDGLEQCDCVPLVVNIEAGWHRVGSPKGWWTLETVQRKGWFSSTRTTMRARYRWVESR